MHFGSDNETWASPRVLEALSRANGLELSCLVQPWQSVLCHAQALP